MIHKLNFIPLLLLFCTKSLAATQAIALPRDSSDKYKVILAKRDGTSIKGTVLSYTEETITILPGTKKETKMGKVFYPETIPFYQIKSIRVLEINLLMLIFFGAIFFIFWKIITGDWDPPEVENEFALLIYISPIGVIAAIINLLKRKKFKINGDKEKYVQFLSRLKKFMPIVSDK